MFRLLISRGILKEKLTASQNLSFLEGLLKASFAGQLIRKPEHFDVPKYCFISWSIMASFLALYLNESLTEV
jgi:hypothetical protein